MAQASILQVLKSVLSAFVGIKSKENRELDFAEGKTSHYIIAGVTIAVLFVVTIIFVVSKVIGS
jgi:hypothetical protein